MRPRLVQDTIVATRRADELISVYASIYVEPKFRVAGGGALRATCAQRQLGSLRIGYGCYGAATEWEFPNAACYLYLLPLDGGGQIGTRSGQYEVRSGRAVMISPDAGFRGKYDVAFANLSVKPDSASLTRVLESMTGMVFNKPLVFEPQTERRTGSALQTYLSSLLTTLEDAKPAATPAWWTAETEHMISVLLLIEERHNYSGLFDSQHAEPSPAQLNRAEEFIAANAQRSVTAEDLARVTGVSVLSLYRGFRKVHGCTPFAFAARLREGH